MGFFSKLAGWFFGGGETVKAVTAVVDESIHTEQEKTETDQADLASARAMQAAPIPMMQQAGFLPTLFNGFNILIECANRVPRPAVTLWIIGGFIGWWPLPHTDNIAEYWQNTFWLILTFWFGGRALLKDLPAAVRMMRGL